MPGPFRPDSFGPPAWFFVPFVLVGGFILFIIVKMIMQAIHNMQQPLIERQARIVGKRQSTRVSGGMNNTPASSHTSFFITFEFEDGAREELPVNGRDYGLLVEGDFGLLRSQGTWFKGFDRQRG